jgi:hypothetical protein
LTKTEKLIKSEKYDEKTIFLEEFSVGDLTLSKGKNYYELFCILPNNIIPQIDPEQELTPIILHSYTILVFGECGNPKIGPFIRHEIFISSPLPEKEYETKEIPVEVEEPIPAYMIDLTMDKEAVEGTA